MVKADYSRDGDCDDGGDANANVRNLLKYLNSLDCCC